VIRAVFEGGAVADRHLDIRQVPEVGHFPVDLVILWRGDSKSDDLP